MARASAASRIRQEIEDEKAQLTEQKEASEGRVEGIGRGEAAWYGGLPGQPDEGFCDPKHEGCFKGFLETPLCQVGE